jgi:hypothetical protein
MPTSVGKTANAWPVGPPWTEDRKRKAGYHLGGQLVPGFAPFLLHSVPETGALAIEKGPSASTSIFTPGPPAPWHVRCP